MNSVSDYSALPDASLNEGKVFTTLANYTDGLGKKFHRGRYVAKSGEWIPALMQGDEVFERVEDVVFRVSTLEGEILEKCDTEHTHVVADITDFIAESEAIAEAAINAVRGANSGVASLDAGGKVPAAQLPSYVDDVLEYANYAALPGTGETGKIYVLVTPYSGSSQFRWSGSAYVAIIASPGSTDSVTEGSTNLYFTNTRAQAAMAATVATINGRLDAVEAHLAKLPKRTDVYTGTTDADGKLSLSFPSGRYASAPVLYGFDVFNNDNYSLVANTLSVSTTAASVCFLREKSTGVLLGGTIVPSERYATQTVTVVAIEF